MHKDLGWGCSCRLCRLAPQNRLDEPHEWIRFLEHIERACLEIVRHERPYYFVWELNGVFYFITKNSQLSAIEEAGFEECELGERLVDARTRPRDVSRTPFRYFAREQLNLAESMPSCRR